MRKNDKEQERTREGKKVREIMRKYEKVHWVWKRTEIIEKKVQQISWETQFLVLIPCAECCLSIYWELHSANFYSAYNNDCYLILFHTHVPIAVNPFIESNIQYIFIHEPNVLCPNAHIALKMIRLVDNFFCLCVCFKTFLVQHYCCTVTLECLDLSLNSYLLRFSPGMSQKRP